jgi:uncharacterized protein DUF4136
MTSGTARLARVTLLLSACYSPPEEAERLEEAVVVTARDEAADFTAYQSFFVRPEIRVLDESALEGAEPTPLPAALAEPLVAATEQNLMAQGYVQAATSGEADLAVELVYLRTIQSDYYCYYWSDWAYWGYPAYVGYGYPYSCSESEWQSGMLVTQVVDVMSVEPVLQADAAEREVLPGLWFAGIYGLEVESPEFVAERAIEGIDQAFLQSSYFTRTP